MVNLKTFDTPDKIAAEGERIYDEKYRAKYEAEVLGHYIVIDVLTGIGYVEQFPEQALEAARNAAPTGIFHLIRIGAPGAFKVSFGAVRHDLWGRPLRQPR